jgi:hypothetical protein
MHIDVQVLGIPSEWVCVHAVDFVYYGLIGLDFDEAPKRSYAVPELFFMFVECGGNDYIEALVISGSEQGLSEVG